MDSTLQRVKEAIETATGGMSAQQLDQHPEGKWSAAGILEHLSITFGGTARLMRKCMEDGKPMASAPTLKQRLAVMLVTGWGYFPTGRPAPEFARPKGLEGEAALQSIRDNLAAMDQGLVEAEQRFGSEVKIADHVVLGPLTIPQWRRFHLVHTRHHMKQIARLRAASSAQSNP
ncbi:MAG: DinB family protein [Acidobacteriota bacterium]|nr:DinB family protein [Acidobacteriota bacterium]